MNVLLPYYNDNHMNCIEITMLILFVCINVSMYKNLRERERIGSGTHRNWKETGSTPVGMGETTWEQDAWDRDSIPMQNSNECKTLMRN